MLVGYSTKIREKDWESTSSIRCSPISTPLYSMLASIRRRSVTTVCLPSASPTPCTTRLKMTWRSFGESSTFDAILRESAGRSRRGEQRPEPYRVRPPQMAPSRVRLERTFDIVLQKIPFLINLTAKERKSMFKASLDTISFVQNAG